MALAGSPASLRAIIRAALLAGGAIGGCWPSTASAQTLTRELFTPVRDGYGQPTRQALRKISPERAPGSALQPDDPGEAVDKPAPSRIGKPPVYTVPAGSGASTTGYDSLNRKRPRPKIMPGGRRATGVIVPPVGTPNPLPPSSQPLSLSPAPPGPPSPASNRTPIAAAVAGLVPGQPFRRPLKAEDDPFGAVGIRTGSFLTKAAVETWAGYDTNPARTLVPAGSAFYTVAPELLIASNWSRHALTADLRGSYSGYDRTFPPPSSVPTDIDRPEFNGKVDGRLDVNRDMRINAQARLRISSDNPGSPNLQAGLSSYPLFSNAGGSLGVEHDFNRLQVSLTGNVDHIAYQRSQLTDGTSSSNDDRDFTQTGGVARVSYDLKPGLKPFVEVEGDVRVHGINVDRSGYQRDSTGGYVKGGSTFELSRLITGEAAIGWTARDYQDPRLSTVSGLLTSASLIWTATPLTTARFIATSSVDESTLPGVSGVLTRGYTMQVDHDFRRWLTGIARFGYASADYDGSDRLDKRYTAGVDLVWRLNREFQIKAQVRRDWLETNAPNANSQATIVMLGVRVQR